MQQSATGRKMKSTKLHHSRITSDLLQLFGLVHRLDWNLTVTKWELPCADLLSTFFIDRNETSVPINIKKRGTLTGCKVYIWIVLKLARNDKNEWNKLAYVPFANHFWRSDQFHTLSSYLSARLKSEWSRVSFSLGYLRSFLSDVNETWVTHGIKHFSRPQFPIN